MNLVEGMKKAGYTKGNVIALTGTPADPRRPTAWTTFKAYMKKYPQYKIVAIEDANWDQATSAKVALQLLSKYRLEGRHPGRLRHGRQHGDRASSRAPSRQAFRRRQPRRASVVTGQQLPRRRHHGDQGAASSTAPRRRRRSRGHTTAIAVIAVLNGKTPPKQSPSRSSASRRQRPVLQGLCSNWPPTR